MLNCVKKYFVNGNSIPTYSSETVGDKKLLNSTSMDFVQYADTLKRNEALSVNITYDDFIEFSGIEKKEFSKKKIE